MNAMEAQRWWMYPFKPVRVAPSVFSTIKGSDYTMERKMDGWRAILIVDKVPELWTRQHTRIEMPKNLQEQIQALKLPLGTVLDGEIWNPLKRGGWKQSKDDECVLSLWDAIRIGYNNISQEPIEKRREDLRSLLRPECNSIQAVEVLEANLETLNQVKTEVSNFKSENVIRSGYVHGVVLKRNTSPRRDHATRSHEHPDWLKIVF